MIANFSDGLRIFLHVLGATVWVGGQLVLAALVPVLRKNGEDLPRKVAAAYNRIAWPAYFLLILSGMWNLSNLPADANAQYHAVLGVKFILVAISGIAAYVHTRAKSSVQIALWGALSGTSALAALFVGVLLAG